MADVVRFAWQNFTQSGNTLLTASSTASGRSVKWLRDPARTKTWRSASGWSFLQRFNDELAFNEDTYRRLAYVTPATYATGALTATQLQTAMGNAGTDPLSFSPTLWLKADALQLADGATVTSWTDSSGNGRHLNSATGTPVFYRSVLNGRPSVRFDQSSYIKASASTVQMDDLLDGSGRGTVLAVVWCDTDHTSQSPVWVSTGQNRALWFDTTNVQARAYDGSQDTATIASSTGSWAIVCWYYDGTNVNAFSNDMDTAAAATAASGAQTSMTADFNLGGDGTDNLKGYISELIVVSGVMTEENRRRLVAYLKQKYALTDTTTAAAYGNTYTVTYSAATFNFTLARATGTLSFGFPWTLDAHEFRSMGLDLGFDTSADDTGATTYTGDNAVYQSRQWVEMDLGSAGLTSQVASVLNHNSVAGGTYTIQAHTTPFWETGTPTYSAALPGDAAVRILYFTDKAYRYWRLLIDDRTNEAGYVEAGIWFVGPYTEPSRGITPGISFIREEMGQVGYGDHGATFFDERPTAPGFIFNITHMSSTDKTAIDAMLNHVKRSRCFLFSRQATGDTTLTYYVYLPNGAHVEHMASTAGLYVTEFALIEPPQ
jgi:hypothetical protein